VHQVEGHTHVPPATLALASATVQLWGACFHSWLKSVDWFDALGSWGVPAARHMQRLYHDLNSRWYAAGAVDGWRVLDMEAAASCLIMATRAVSVHTLFPPHLGPHISYVNSVEAL
jgi:hypothetical protein